MERKEGKKLAKSKQATATAPPPQSDPLPRYFTRRKFIGTGGAGVGATIAGGMLGNGAYDTAKGAGHLVY